jgi:hypothetical protein
VNRFLSTRSFALVLTATGLAACKTTIETQVNLSDILGTDPRTLVGDLYFEVSACDNYEDSRKPSDSLLRAQDEVPVVFPDAKYVECFTQRFDSFAHFKTEVALVKDAQALVPDRINLVAINPDALLALGIPEGMRNRLNRMREDNLTSLELETIIHVKNDTGQDFPFRVLAAYINDEPAVYGIMTSKPDREKFTLKLSDVSIDAALKYGVAQVLAIPPRQQ